MYCQLSLYDFKNDDAYAQGLAYLKDTYVPSKQQAEGFASLLIAEAGPRRIGVLLRFRNEEKLKAASVTGSAFQVFTSQLSAPPKIVSGLNVIADYPQADTIAGV
ncbi:hypothetical protein QEH52_17890 [Coraliomargarita sp. SDUM461003]|uniref:ABM domain-containing protein n=1 Tax=Thalassobacterium maritimum TaxID=3041265 RepID=A0ABU1B1C3_9BACT|nr:hypothetical protein [Coraliomargarita sp. SDUM461003]MDQ8209405.1 hypothetical protein [Coraliomargarita sp. SDUM461003]